MHNCGTCAYLPAAASDCSLLDSCLRTRRQMSTDSSHPGCVYWAIARCQRASASILARWPLHCASSPARSRTCTSVSHIQVSGETSRLLLTYRCAGKRRLQSRTAEGPRIARLLCMRNLRLEGGYRAGVLHAQLVSSAERFLLWWLRWAAPERLQTLLWFAHGRSTLVHALGRFVSLRARCCRVDRGVPQAHEDIVYALAASGVWTGGSAERRCPQ